MIACACRAFPESRPDPFREPLLWGEFGDATGGVLVDALQYVDQARVEIDAVQSAGDDQTLHDAHVLGTPVRSSKKCQRLRPIGMARSARWGRAQLHA